MRKLDFNSLGKFPKMLVFSFAVFLFFSACNFINGDEKLDENATIDPEPVGGQKDEHGCLVPAGYTWSALKQECVRIFEAAFGC